MSATAAPQISHLTTAYASPQTVSYAPMKYPAPAYAGGSSGVARAAAPSAGVPYASSSAGMAVPSAKVTYTAAPTYAAPMSYTPAATRSTPRREPGLPPAAGREAEGGTQPPAVYASASAGEVTRAYAAAQPTTTTVTYGAAQPTRTPAQPAFAAAQPTPTAVAYTQPGAVSYVRKQGYAQNQSAASVAHTSPQGGEPQAVGSFVRSQYPAAPVAYQHTATTSAIGVPSVAHVAASTEGATKQAEAPQPAAPRPPASRLSNYICPSCSAQFRTLEEVGEHYAAAHSSSSTSKPALSAVAAPQEAPTAVAGSVEVQRVVKHICPDCSGAYQTAEEVKAHWMQEHYHGTEEEFVYEEVYEEVEEEEAAEPEGHEIAGASASTPKAEMGQAHLIEADAEGRPLIVRHTYQKTGVTRTVVMNDDGTQRVFGEDTITSMMTRNETDIEKWIEAMTDRHLRGLVNELSVRLCEHFQRLNDRRQEFEALSRQANFAFFGLREGAAERDLDNAYRKLARTMHPDKNGGTEEAKLRFQGMKGKYEELKLQLANGSPSATRAAAAGAPPRDEVAEAAENPQAGGDGGAGGLEAAQVGDEAAEKEEDDGGRGKGAPSSGDEGEDEAAPEGQEALGGPSSEGGGAVQGPASSRGTGVTSRATLEEKAWKMLRQLKMIGQNLRIVESNFEQLRVELQLAEEPVPG